MAPLYHRLPRNNFRLLRKVAGANERDLRFRFINAARGQPFSYTAVSYTWGDDVKNEKIFVDDKPVMVKPSLWACLYFLRREWPLIWVDAVSINQDDVAERNEQVRMMRHIYAGAAVVSVWLGNVPLPETLNIEGRVVTIEVDDFDWSESMEEIARRPYWTRCWVIQEFLIAKEVHIYCSNCRVDDWFFRDLLERAADIDLLTVSITDLVQKPDLMRKWPALPLVIERHCDRYPDLAQPLYDLLAGHAYAQSTDPKDKIFALLGLLPSEERSLLERCFPDYNLSLEQVNIVTLAHLAYFAGDQPCKPIFTALHIDETREIDWLLQIAGRLDYGGAENPAADAEYHAAQARWDIELGVSLQTARQTHTSVLTPNITLNRLLHQTDQQQTTRLSRVSKWVGLTIVVLLSGVALLKWAQRLL